MDRQREPEQTKRRGSQQRPSAHLIGEPSEDGSGNPHDHKTEQRPGQRPWEWNAALGHQLVGQVDERGVEGQ